MTGAIKVRVIIVDDHDLVRTGIRRVLEDDDDIHVVGEACNGEEGLALLAKQPTDVVLMDMNMPGIGGLEAIRRITLAKNGVRVIVLSMHRDGALPRQALEAGAAGYLTKGCSLDECVTAIHQVWQGNTYVSREVAQNMLVSDLKQGQGTPLSGLSRRETQILRLIAQGQKIQEVSKTLSLSPKTVWTYRSRMFKKLGVSSDVELTHLALRHGIVDSQTLG